MRFTITIEGDVEELPAVSLEKPTSSSTRTMTANDKDLVVSKLQRMLADLQPENGRPLPTRIADTDNAAFGDLGWTFAELQQAWQSFRPGTKQILNLIAHKPTGCPMSQIQDALEETDGKLTVTQGIGGRLSSLSTAYKEYPGRQRLYTYDPVSSEYKMAPEIAVIILELTKAP